MLCKCCWIVLYTVHFTAFCLRGGGVFFPDAMYILSDSCWNRPVVWCDHSLQLNERRRRQRDRRESCCLQKGKRIRH